MTSFPAEYPKRVFRDERAVTKEVTHVDFVGSDYITGDERGERKR